MSRLKLLLRKEKNRLCVNKSTDSAYLVPNIQRRDVCQRSRQAPWTFASVSASVSTAPQSVLTSITAIQASVALKTMQNWLAFVEEWVFLPAFCPFLVALAKGFSNIKMQRPMGL